MNVDAKKKQLEAVAWVAYFGAICAVWAIFFPTSWQDLTAKFQAFLGAASPLVFFAIISPLVVRVSIALLSKDANEPQKHQD